jgi:type II secretory ATPase GspE/PulE/Tfp pilus assembly ATPase PilB-like protein
MILPYLIGKISAEALTMVTMQTNLAFKTGHGITAPEALVLYTQNIMQEPALRKLLADYYKTTFMDPQYSWVAPDIIDFYSGTEYVPVRLNNVDNILYLGKLAEFKTQDVKYITRYKTEIVNLTLYDYVNLYTKCYSKRPDFLHEIPPKDLFNMVVLEGLELGASDIRITQRDRFIEVSYSVNKRKVFSKRTLPAGVMEEIVKLITTQARAATSVAARKPAYMDINLDERHRGRVVNNYTYFGSAIVIRILSNEIYSRTFKSLNIPDDVVSFIRKSCINLRPGLKLFCGETASGKNTTIMTTLNELHRAQDMEIISVEQPVEIVTDFIKQINTQTDEEYNESAGSLLRQNPDVVYIAEMTDRTALTAVKVANTGKPVFSTVHCNSVADVVSRVIDLTGLSLTRVVMILDTVVYQKLLPVKCPKCGDDGCADCHTSGMIPVFNYLYFDDGLKKSLLGKTLEEVYMIIDEATMGKEMLDKLVSQGRISEKTHSWR